MAKSKRELERLAQEKAEAIRTLKRLLKPGQVVYTVNERVLRSNMGAYIKVLVGKGREVVDISGRVAEALGMKWDGGVFFSGCGLDRGYFLVSRLSRAVFGTDTRAEGGLRQEWL